MGTFRTAQNNFLTSSEKELVDYNVYDKDGVFKITEEKDVLLITPNQLIPIDSSLTVEYLRPVNKVELSAKLKKRNISNNNPHFHYDRRRWDLSHQFGLTTVFSTVVDDNDLSIDADFTLPVSTFWVRTSGEFPVVKFPNSGAASE